MQINGERIKTLEVHMKSIGLSTRLAVNGQCYKDHETMSLVDKLLQIAVMRSLMCNEASESKVRL